MMKKIAFLHTSPVHVPTFTDLLVENGAGILGEHFVDESLLADARATGITEDVRQRIRQYADNAIVSGASVMLCTCSTIGGAAEELDIPGLEIIRVDRPMAARAVAIGGRILILATVKSTLIPTRELIDDEIAKSGKVVTAEMLVCGDAWNYFEARDQQGYLQTIADFIKAHGAGADVIVLAQASMAGAVDLLGDFSVPILSSPRLGMQAAIGWFDPS
jgi:hypothetical protein